jgi:histone H3/H4
MRIDGATTSTVATLWASADLAVRRATCLEEAAQALAESLHTTFEESVVIARVFFTVPFGELPSANREFVEHLADSAGAAAELNAETPVLSLLGTHGSEPAWQDRRRSKDHVGIPLISSSFVGAIPMISRLLRELGVPVHWVDRHDSEMIASAVGDAEGLFFVEDAGEAVDQEGRKIIAAQDFVADRGVKSVFGLGGAYEGGEIMVIVVFCRDRFTREVAESFLPLAKLFITKTSRLASPGMVFSPAD